jgi:hypothetical protein
MKRVISFWSITGAIAVALFVSTELVVAAAAAVWAVSGLLALDGTAMIVFGTLVAIPSLYGIVKIAILAFEAETDPENN